MILEKSPLQRNIFELRALREKFINSKFMQELVKKNEFETITRICQQVTHVVIDQPDNTIFKYGDVGDLFYIIIKGTVGVFVPVICNVHLSYLEYYKLCNEYSENILEVNGIEKYEIPNLPNKISNLSKLMDMSYIIKRMDRSDKINETGELSMNDIASLQLAKKESLARINSDVHSSIITTEEGKCLEDSL